MEHKQLEEMKNMDFMGFMDTLHALLVAYELGGLDWSERFVMQNPTTTDSKDVTLPIIVWNLKERLPGQITKEHRELKPRRRTIQKINEETLKMEDFIFDGRILDILLEVTVFGHTNKEVLQYTRLFTDMMDTFKGTFMKEGLLNFWFVSETEGIADHKKDEMSSRIISYRVRVQESTEINVSTIKKIELNIETVLEKLAREKRLPSQFNE